MGEPDTIAAHERACFEAHGWLVLRQAVAPAVVARLTRAFDRVSARALAAAPRARAGRLGVWQLPAVHREEPALLEHLRGPLGARLARILGAARLQLLQDVLLGKPAHGAGSVALHQDYAYTAYLTPPRALSARLALSPGTVADGCLYVLDGSHTWGYRPELAASLLTDGDVSVPPEFRARAATAARALELAPGDVSLHHCLTLHGSHPNRGPRTTRTLITHLFDGRCRLDRARLPDARTAARFPTDADGRLCAETFPVVFGDPVPTGPDD